MQKRAVRQMIARVIVLAMLISLLGTAVSAVEGQLPTYQEVTNTIMAFKDQENGQYREGALWTNDHPYNDGNGLPLQVLVDGIRRVGRGCAALAYYFRNAAFGDFPIYVNSNVTFDNICVGDILEMNGHVAIVTDRSAGGIILVEGNYNSSVHWGRVLSRRDIDELHVVQYALTSYPDGYVPADDPDANTRVAGGELGENLSWLLTKSGTLMISGTGSVPDYDQSGDGAAPWSISHVSSDVAGSVRTIVIGDGVTRVGNNAFFQCKGALTAFLPGTLTSVGQSAFQESGLVSVTIPSSAKKLEDSAFRNCQSLVSVTLSEGVESIGDNAFRGCTTLNYIDFPSTVNYVGAGALMDCTHLTRARFVPSDTKVTWGANGVFARCQRMNELVLPRNIDSLCDSMFLSTETSFTVYLPATITSIGNAFVNSSINRIYFEGTREQWNAILSKMTEADKTIKDGVKLDTYALCSGELGWSELVNFAEKHVHVWSEDWSLDDTHHWRDCVDADNVEVHDYAEHSYLHGVCVCGRANHEHAYSGDWRSDSTRHWQECSVVDQCPIEGNRADHVAGSDGKCTTCDYVMYHVHKWSEDWASNDTTHWHECEGENLDCTATNNSQKSGYGSHTGNWVIDIEPTTTQVGSQYRICSDCAYRQTKEVAMLTPEPSHTHRWSAYWVADDTAHWHDCEIPGCSAANSQKSGYGEHTGEWVIDIEPTTTQVGSQHRICNICAYRFTKDVAIIDVDDPAVDDNPSNPTNPDNPNNPSGGSGGSSNTPSGSGSGGSSSGSGSSGGSSSGGGSGGSSGGAGGGGGSGGSSNQNPDGSSTTTTIDSETGAVTTVDTDADGNVVTTMEMLDGSSIMTIQQIDGTSATVTKSALGKTEANVMLSEASVANAQMNNTAVKLPIPEVEVASDVEDAATIYIETGSSEPVKVEVPVTLPTAGTVIAIVNPDGTLSVIKTSVATLDGMMAAIPDGATIKVIDNSKDYADVASDAWSADAVDFASSRELFSGVSSTSFAPDEPMTRAMTTTVLARLDDVDTSGGETWYEKGADWAKSRGISDGANLDSSISREQLATMLWRYAGSPTSANGLAGYADAGSVSPYSQSAMDWATSNGIISGFGNGRVAPKEQATRAQVAQMLMNYVKHSS